MAGQSPESRTVYVGSRTLHNHGASIVISIPKKELREELGVEVADHAGETATASLDDSGEYTVDLGRLVEEANEKNKVRIDAD